MLILSVFCKRNFPDWIAYSKKQQNRTSRPGARLRRTIFVQQVIFGDAPPSTIRGHGIFNDVATFTMVPIRIHKKRDIHHSLTTCRQSSAIHRQIQNHSEYSGKTMIRVSFSLIFHPQRLPQEQFHKNTFVRHTIHRADWVISI